MAYFIAIFLKNTMKNKNEKKKSVFPKSENERIGIYQKWKQRKFEIENQRDLNIYDN